MVNAFNSAVETGVRSVAMLTSLYPKAVDLQHLVYFDYLILHSADVGGPESLHAALPLRSGELTVRRALLEEGLLLMLHRGLLQLRSRSDGFFYEAVEGSAAFLSMLTSPYVVRLVERAQWVASAYGESPLAELMELEHKFFKEWSIHFQSLQVPEVQK